MNPISTILFSLIFIAIGFLIGYLVSGSRARAPGEATGDKPGAYSRKGAARLWRDPLSQRLMIEMDGNVYRNPGEISGEQRLRLAHLVGEASAWMPRKPGQPPADAVEAVAGARSAAGQLHPAVQEDAGKPKTEVAQQSIAAQIDEILQRKLAETPLAARGIKLVELPGQGMVVMIGLEKFTDLTLVPDEEVRSVIAEAVQEWEDKAGSYRG